MKKKIPKWLLYMIFVFIILMILILVGGYFILSTQKDVDLQNKKYLEELAVQNAKNIKTTVEMELDKLEAISNILGNQEEFHVDYTLEVLKAESARTSFKRLAYIPSDGNAITTDGVSFSVLDRDYYKKALEGKSTVSDRIQDKIGGESINVYAVPLYHKGTIKGVVIATNNTTFFSSMLSVNTFYGAGISYVTKKDGSMVAYGWHEDSFSEFDNLFEEIQKSETAEKAIVAMQRDMEHDQNGIIECYHDSTDYIAAYSKIGINDWYAVSLVPKTVINENTNRLIYRNISSVVITVLALGLLLLLILLQNHRSKKKLEELAFLDPLTGGNNLNKFKALALQMLSKQKEGFYMVRIDVDNFKLINDMYGHAEGDMILQEMSQLIAKILSCEDIYGRIGNDDFICLLKCNTKEELIEKGTVFREAFKKILEEKSKRYRVNFTTGVYQVHFGEVDIDKMIDRATMAHRRAKQLPHERKFAFYSEEIRESAIWMENIESKMHKALSNNEFVVYYQPKYNLHSGKMEGAEALVRWFFDGKILSPAEFLPVFEKNGFIVNIDLYVLEEVCRMQRIWIDEGIEPIPISVNQSKPLVYGADYVSKICDIVRQYEILPQLIELELLEHLIHDNVRKLKKVTEELRSFGFLISIDDFGSGYSSLNLLKDICADVLKIDKEFLSNAENNQRAEIVLQNMIELAKGLNMSVVTEGVETKKQEMLLKSLGCDMGQGYLYAKPMPASEFEQLLSAKIPSAK